MGFHQFVRDLAAVSSLRRSWRWLLQCYVFIAMVGTAALNQLNMASALSQANANSDYQQHDLLLLCTGTGMKWASLSEFQATGKIRYVAAPLPADHSDSTQVSCPCSHLVNLKQPLPLFSAVLLPAQQVWVSVTRLLPPLRLQLIAYATPHSRAPPL